MLDISADVADVEDWQLRTVLIAKPAVQVNWNDVNTVNLNSDKSLTIWNNTISKDNLKDVADELKWYNISAIWYTSFDTEQEAKDFRDTYFSNYEVYQIWTTWKYIVLTEYNDWWSNNINDKVDTQTREDLLTLNNWTWNSEPSTPTEPTWPTEEELLQQQVNTIKANLMDEVTDLQTYLTSQWLNTVNNTTIENMISQVITKINWINWTNKDEKNTEILWDISTIQTLIDSLKAEEVAAAAEPIICEEYQQLDNWVCRTAIYLDSNWITMKATNYAVAWNEYTLSWKTYYVVVDKSDLSNKINEWTYTLDQLITTRVTNMAALFNRKTNYVFNWSVSGWDTSNVTNIAQMFRCANNFNQDIWYWDMSNVTSVHEMLSWYTCNSYWPPYSFNNWWSDSINNWNTSNITNMWALFHWNRVFNQPINNWNTSKVTTIQRMFNWATSFNQDLSWWDFSHVISWRHSDAWDSWASSWQSNYKPTLPF
jgi:hypothetical protein